MKILFYIDSLQSGGKERRLVEIIQGLSKKPNYELSIILSKKEIHYQEILSTNIKIYYLERPALHKSWRIFFKFYKIVNLIKPDIIHVWNYTECLISIPTKLILGIPLVNNQIASTPVKVSKSIFRHRLTFAFSNKILANSYSGLLAYKNVMTKNKFESSKVIYNGFNFDRISNLKKEKTIRDEFEIKTKYIIGMVANFTHKKDYKTFLEAANLVLKTNREVTFICVGDGNSQEYREIVLPSNINSVKFLGKQNNVESIMAICDIGVLITNSETHGEGIPNSVLEFMALKKPVLANSCGGTKELVSHENNGFLIKNNDSEDLKSKILLILENNDLKFRFGNESERIVSQKFSYQNMISEFDLVYESFQKSNCS